MVDGGKNVKDTNVLDGEAVDRRRDTGKEESMVKDRWRKVENKYS